MVFSRCSVFATSQFNIFEVQKDSFFCGNTKVFERFCRQAKDLLRTVYNTRSCKLACKGLRLRRFTYLKAKTLVFAETRKCLKNFADRQKIYFVQFIVQEVCKLSCKALLLCRFFSNRDAQFIVEVACGNLKYDLSEF